MYPLYEKWVNYILPKFKVGKRRLNETDQSEARLTPLTHLNTSLKTSHASKQKLFYELQQYPLLYDCKLNDYKDIQKKDNGGVSMPSVRAEDEVDIDGTVEDDLGKSRDGSRTDDEVVQREEEAIQLDGLSAAQIKELREKSEKHVFQAEVNRMMKLIINSLYKNKEIFLRELISNASDALDKIRLMSLTNEDALAGNEELTIKIKSDKEKNMLHITDTGIGMTREELVKNLGTIAKSGTSEFLNKMTEMQTDDQSTSELIGQFGVGFYSAFLVADKVIVTSKHNNDTQQIWESDSNAFSVIEDPRGNTLGRGSTITLVMKEEASDYLELETIKNLVKKYSQFINFPIYVWSSKTETVEEPLDEAEDEAEKDETDEEAEVEEEDEEKEKKPKTKKVEKTVWDWELMNDIKPIWQRQAKEVEEDEYTAFYKTFSKDTEDPLCYIHFTAEGEVTFKSILFVPGAAPRGIFEEYGSKKNDYIKLFVRRVFITDDFNDMMPKYLNFVKGVVDSDDLPLNVSRETLQQHKLLKVIRKKLVRKTLDMIKKIADEKYNEKFWKEFGTNIKLGVIEDHSNRTRLAKLLRFHTSHSETELSSLEQYVERMKEKQDKIYFMAGTSRKEAQSSPFVEALLKKGYEVVYLTEPVDEYCIQALPEFDGKRFQNVAKEGVKFEESDKAKERREAMAKDFEPLTNWMKEKSLKDKIEKAVLSQRLTDSPCALVASQYGWSGNMERIMKAQAYQTGKDISTNYYASQKKTLEINPRHPLIKEMLKRINENEDDQTAADLAVVLFETATLRSGYQLADTKEYAERIERMLRLSMNVDLAEKQFQALQATQYHQMSTVSPYMDGSREDTEMTELSVHQEPAPVPEPVPTKGKRGRPPTKEPKKPGPKKAKAADGAAGGKQEKISDAFKKVKRKMNRFNGVSEAELMTKTLPDILTFNLDIVIVGINPGLMAAHKGHHYPGPGNHFWKCLFLSGLSDTQLNHMDDQLLPEKCGIGFTNMVERTTPGSKDLSSKEFREGGRILVEKLKKYKPVVAAFNGKCIYEIFSKEIFGVKIKKFEFGLQPHRIPETETACYVMPSSSARCAQFPRAQDKVHYYIKLKELRDQLKGQPSVTKDVQELDYSFDLKLAKEDAKRMAIKEEKYDPGYEAAFGGACSESGPEGNGPCNFSATEPGKCVKGNLNTLFINATTSQLFANYSIRQ
ncbi:ENPL protein, partial [Polyodon spathula]|nr:ENPL protein [Polyodon spathula]